ncbi:MAG: hypothetical protein HY814_13765 [Candidatus Riflebacteria bacterium]|nr:hypothetical protein [Candidatus Riflebacteria bacterium]
MPDAVERQAGLGPLSADTDADGAQDGEELLRGWDPRQADTDGDGLNDGTEIHSTLTAPELADSDSDGISDSDEVLRYETEPLLFDSDADGVPDASELSAGLKANSADSDADGLTDDEEYRLGISNPLNPDTDGDRLTDGDEHRTHHTSPVLQDTDGDGRSDPEELRGAIRSDPLSLDTDADGLLDSEEVALGTDPSRHDTDSDGFTDTDEVSRGLDPLRADTDGDNLNDCRELYTNAFDPDSDLDGVRDDADSVMLAGRPYGELSPDQDFDGLRDGEEHTDRAPLRGEADSDRDGVGDGLEVAVGRDPAIYEQGAVTPPGGGTVAFDSIRRVVRGGIRQDLLAGDAVLASDLGLEVTVRSTLADVASGRVSFAFQADPSAGSGATPPGRLTVSPTSYSVPRGVSRFYTALTPASPGTIQVRLFTAAGATLAQRSIAVRRVVSIRQLVRAAADGKVTTLFEPSTGHFLQDARTSDRFIKLILDNPNPEPVGLRFSVAPEAAGFLQSHGLDPGAGPSDTEILYVVPKACTGFAVNVSFRREPPAGPWPQRVPVHIEVASLTADRVVILKEGRGPEPRKLPEDLMVVTRPSETYRVQVEYSSAVGCPLGEEGEGEPEPPPWNSAKAAAGSPPGKENRFALELLSSIGRKPPTSAVFRVKLVDAGSGSEPLVGVPVRVVARRGPTGRPGAVSAALLVENGTARRALTNKQGTVTGILAYAGGPGDAVPHLAELEVLVGAVADRPDPELEHELAQWPATFGQRSLTGHSILYETTSPARGRMAFQVPVVPEPVWQVALNLWEPVFAETGFSGLERPPMRHFLDLPNPADQVLSLAVFSAYRPGVPDPLFQNKQLTGQALTAELFFQWMSQGLISTKALASRAIEWGCERGAAMWENGGREVSAVLAMTAALAGALYVAVRSGPASGVVVAGVSGVAIAAASPHLLAEAYEALRGSVSPEVYDAMTSLVEGHFRGSLTELENAQLLQRVLESYQGGKYRTMAELLRHPEDVPGVVRAWVGWIDKLAKTASRRAALRLQGVSADLALKLAAETRKALVRQTLLPSDPALDALVDFVAEYAKDGNAVDLARGAWRAVELRDRLQAALDAGELKEYLAKHVGWDKPRAADELARSVFDAVTTTDTPNLTRTGLETVARIIAHQHTQYPPNDPRNGVTIARKLVGNKVFQNEGIQTRLLEALQTRTDGGKYRLMERAGSRTFLKDLATADNPGKAWEAIVLHDKYPLAEFEKKYTLDGEIFEVDIVHPRGIVEIKSGGIDKREYPKLLRLPRALIDNAIFGPDAQFVMETHQEDKIPAAEREELTAAGWVFRHFE